MRILLAPLWVRGLYWCLVGAVVALLAGAFSTQPHRPIVLNWPTGTVVFILIAVGVGAVLTWRSQTTRQPYLAQVEGLSPAQRRAAIKATTTGPAPEDPDVLKAALRLGTVYLDHQKANRRRTQVVTAVLMTIAIFLLVVAAYQGDAWGLVYPVIALIVVPLARWWTEAVVQRTARQNRMLVAARRQKRKKRV